MFQWTIFFLGPFFWWRYKLWLNSRTVKLQLTEMGMFQPLIIELREYLNMDRWVFSSVLNLFFMPYFLLGMPECMLNNRAFVLLVTAEESTLCDHGGYISSAKNLFTVIWWWMAVGEGVIFEQWMWPELAGEGAAGSSHTETQTYTGTHTRCVSDAHIIQRHILIPFLIHRHMHESSLVLL